MKAITRSDAWPPNQPMTSASTRWRSIPGKGKDMKRFTRTQTTEIAVAGSLVTRSHPQLDHDEVGIFVQRAFDALSEGSDFVSAQDIAAEAGRILAKSFAKFPAAGAPTRMQRLETTLTQAGLLAEEIEHEEGRVVHVLLLSDDRNATVRGLLAPTVTAYQRPHGC